MPRPAYFVGSALFLAASVVVFRARPSTACFRRNNPSIAMTAKPLTDSKLAKAEKKDAKFWNNMAENYSKKPVADEESYKKKLAITQEYFNSETRVLEFGCGTGSTAIVHSPYVKEIDAIDLSSGMIDIAKEKAEKQGASNIHFEAIGIDRFHAPDESYDAVLGMSILHLLPNKDEAISKVHKMLKPGGVFVSSTVCMGDFVGFLKYCGPVMTYFGVFPKLNVFTAKELKESLTGAGFEIEREFQPGKDKGLFLVAKKI